MTSVPFASSANSALKAVSPTQNDVQTRTRRTSSPPAIRTRRAISVDPLPIPTPRGPVSAALIAVLTGRVGSPPIVASFDAQVERAIIASHDILTDGDLQLALLCFGALDAGGLGLVDSRWAAEPILVAARENLETALEEALRDEVPVPSARQARGAVAAGESVVDTVAGALDRLIADTEATSPYRYLAEQASGAQLREHLVARSIRSVLVNADQRVVADDATAALRLRARLGEQGLQVRRGWYVDVVDVRVLAAVNTTALLARFDRLRGCFYGLRTATGLIESLDEIAVVGALGRHTMPLSKARTARGSGAGRSRIAAGLVVVEPALLDDVLFGAAVGVTVERWITEQEVVRWQVGRSALHEGDAISRDEVLRADRAAEAPPVDDRPIMRPVERTGGIRR